MAATAKPNRRAIKQGVEISAAKRADNPKGAAKKTRKLYHQAIRHGNVHINERSESSAKSTSTAQHKKEKEASNEKYTSKLKELHKKVPKSKKNSAIARSIASQSKGYK